MKSARNLTCFQFVFINLSLLNSVFGIQCYRCVSNQPGCGKELSIRTQRWQTCDLEGKYGGENFCVKLIEERDSNIVITRECLSTMLSSTRHREKMPTVRRHNYCQYGRNNDPMKPYDTKTHFCFCNDRDGCNAAFRVTFSNIILLILVTEAFIFANFLFL